MRERERSGIVASRPHTDPSDFSTTTEKSNDSSSSNVAVASSPFSVIAEAAELQQANLSFTANAAAVSASTPTTYDSNGFPTAGRETPSTFQAALNEVTPAPSAITDVGVDGVGTGGDRQPLKPARECDFDADPTELYLTIQRKEWDKTVHRSNTNPDEAGTWVSRKERDGKLRWRLLPLHAAIIFKAPEKAIEALLCAYPPGAQCKDDQGMLPIHLAFRNGSSEGVVNLLLVAYPQSIDVKDRKGRIPLTLAQASASPNKDAFIRALERGPSYYAVAAAATERAAVTAEQRAIFDSKLVRMKEQSKREIDVIHRTAKGERQVLEEKIQELESELIKTQETSQVLVDHVNSLEAQLSSRSDTERFLATKIATLDTSLKEAVTTKETLERDLGTSNETLSKENEMLKSKLDKLENSEFSYKSKIGDTESTLRKIKENSSEKQRKSDEIIRSLEIECANSRANAAVLEAQLKKKIETEHTLASQVSELAAKLAESAQASSTATSSYVNRVEQLETEKQELKRTVEELTSKLSSVARALDAMAIEQERIVRAAAMHEETMARAAAAQDQILEDTRRQEGIMLEAARERRRIIDILTKQAEEVEQNSTERERIAEAVKKQEEDMAMCRKEREGLVESVSRQRVSMRELAGKELAGIPKVMPTKHGYDDGTDGEGDGRTMSMDEEELIESVLGGQEVSVETKASIDQWAVDTKASIDEQARNIGTLKQIASEDLTDENNRGLLVSELAKQIIEEEEMEQQEQQQQQQRDGTTTTSSSQAGEEETTTTTPSVSTTQDNDHIQESQEEEDDDDDDDDDDTSAFMSDMLLKREATTQLSSQTAVVSEAFTTPSMDVVNAMPTDEQTLQEDQRSDVTGSAAGSESVSRTATLSSAAAFLIESGKA